jgi:hypothetical protein
LIQYLGLDKEPLINSVKYAGTGMCWNKKAHQRSFLTGVDFARNVPIRETHIMGISRGVPLKSAP